MKALVSIFLGASLLVSCVALPKPETESDSLVIGFFSLVFPGGYFSSPLTTIDRGVELDFRDVTTGRWHVEFTIGGTFKFIAHGGDRYALISSRASLLDASRRFIMGPRAIKLEIPSSPGRYCTWGTFSSRTPPLPTCLHFTQRSITKYAGEGGWASPTLREGAPAIWIDPMT